MFWEYQFTDRANPTNISRRQFLCGVNVKPNRALELRVFSLSAPSDVVSVDRLANKSDDLFLE